MHNNDLLVILSDDQTDKALEYINSHFTVKQKASPRVLVIGRPAQDTSMQSISGVIVATEDEVSSEIIDTLNTAEALFVRAWFERLKMDQKQRPGEGLSWDDKGFEPPDSPDSSK